MNRSFAGFSVLVSVFFAATCRGDTFNFDLVKDRESLNK